MSPQQLEFSARIARINAGAMNTRTTVYVGVDDAFSFIPKARVMRGEGLIGVMQNTGYPLAFVASVLIGIVAHALTVWCQFKLTGLPDAAVDPTTAMGVTLVLGFVTALVLGYLSGLSSRESMAMKSLGVVLGTLFFHNAVHVWPQVFEQAFSKVWVAHIVTTTEAHSLLFRGISFTF
jgi:hypothetical protein